MNTLSLVTSITLAAHLYHGIYILLINRHSKLNRLYFLATVAITFFAIMFVIAHQQQTITDILFYYKVGMFAFVPYFALCLHFTVELTITKRFRYFFIYGFYFLAVLFIIQNIFSTLVYKEFIRIDGSISVVLNSENILEYILFVSYMLSVGTICMILFYNWGKQAKDKKTKMQSRFLAITLMIIVLALLCEYIILPMLFNYRKFTMGISWYILLVFTTVFISIRYRFLNNNSNVINNYIMQNLGEIILLFNKDLKMIHANDKAAILFSTNLDFNNRSFDEIVLECDDCKQQMQYLLENPTEENNKKITLINNEKNNITINANFTIAKDSLGDIIGFLLTAREIQEVKDAQSKFELTDRQVEVINHLLTGKPAREIGQILQITERTVKAHITTIYNKLGINSKYELYCKLNNM